MLISSTYTVAAISYMQLSLGNDHLRCFAVRAPRTHPAKGAWREHHFPTYVQRLLRLISTRIDQLKFLPTIHRTSLQLKATVDLSTTLGSQ